jgi:fatty acid desaturase
MSWADYGSHLILATALTLACVVFSSMSCSPILAGLAGALAVPIVIFQHDVRHLYHRNDTFEEHLSDVLVLVTGTCYGILPWTGVHVKHHSYTGNYRGAVLAESLRDAENREGDLDDLAGPLRHGNPFGSTARSNPILRLSVATFCILLTISLFQGMFMVQSLVGPFQQKSSSKLAPVVWKGALLTVAHLVIGVLLLGVPGYAMYSIGMSACLTLLTAPVHHAKGVQCSSKGFYAKQVAGTANIADHDSLMIRYFMMGNDYHIEHHIWPRVPGTKKQQLAAYTKSYCEQNGLEYREIGLFDAWQQWAMEAWTLAGMPFKPTPYIGLEAEH